MSGTRNKTLARRLLVAFAGQATRPEEITRDEWKQVKGVRRTNAKARKARRQLIRANRRAAR
jgi:hypothetical protein